MCFILILPLNQDPNTNKTDDPVYFPFVASDTDVYLILRGLQTNQMRGPNISSQHDGLALLRLTFSAEHSKTF